MKTEYSQIPWRNIAGMRDIVVHNYETIKGSLLENEKLEEVLVYCEE